jgi:hypothetical protein
MKYYLVTGRADGDDEDTAMQFPADGPNHAAEKFNWELRLARNLPTLAASGPEIYVNTIARSDTPITLEFES